MLNERQVYFIKNMLDMELMDYLKDRDLDYTFDMLPIEILEDFFNQFKSSFDCSDEIISVINSLGGINNGN